MEEYTERMAEQITKKNFKELSVSIGKAMDKRLGGFERSINKRFESFGTSIDKRFDNFEHSIIQTVGKQLHDFEQRNDARFRVIEGQLFELREETREVRAQIQQLTVTLDRFLKRLTDFDDEFAILKAEVDLIKDILKKKLGVEVALQK